MTHFPPLSGCIQTCGCPSSARSPPVCSGPSAPTLDTYFPPEITAPPVWGSTLLGLPHFLFFFLSFSSQISLFFLKVFSTTAHHPLS